MTRNDFIAAGLSLGVVALTLLARRKPSVVSGESAHMRAETKVVEPGSVDLLKKVLPPEPGVRVGDDYRYTSLAHLIGRIRDLLAKAKRDVASVTEEEANEMRMSVSTLRASGYNYEGDSVETLLAIRENYLRGRGAA